MLTLPQACILVGAALPRRRLTVSEAIELVRHIQHSNYRAKASHYRAREKRRDKP